MHKIKKVVLGASATILFLCLFAWNYIPDTMAARNGTQATTFSASIQPSIAISVSSASISLNIHPSSGGTTGASEVFYANTYTNTPHSLFINFTSTDLTSADGHTIPTFTTGGSAGHSIGNIPVNHWGFSCNADGNYYCADLTSYRPATTSPAQIFNNQNSNMNISFRIGAKVDLNTSPGEYMTTINFYAVAQPST